MNSYDMQIAISTFITWLPTLLVAPVVFAGCFFVIYKVFKLTMTQGHDPLEGFIEEECVFLGLSMIALPAGVATVMIMMILNSLLDKIQELGIDATGTLLGITPYAILAGVVIWRVVVFLQRKIRAYKVHEKLSSQSNTK